jgi:hypothetical protein
MLPVLKQRLLRALWTGLLLGAGFAAGVGVENAVK